MPLKRTLIALFIFAPNMLLAQPADPASPYSECTEVDLNKDEKSPLRSIPVYDQDGAPICYAYTMAQMMDYYRFKNNSMRDYNLTSPLSVALVIQKTNLNTEASSGIGSTADGFNRLGSVRFSVSG